jgi:bacteriocin biosynthesis cyclodehydratase domain-containing protein
MATALRVTRSHVVVAGVGDLGEHVARLLAGDRPDYELVAADALGPAIAAAPDAAVVAMWRPCPSLCDTVDDLAFRNRRPWLPVVMEHPYLLVGPWVSPGTGACYRCYRARRVQHDGQHRVTSALGEAYERDPACGPQGYLPHQARIAASLAEMVLRKALSGLHGPAGDDVAAGEVTSVNVLNGKTSRHRVVACHGCPRCSPTDRLGGRADGYHGLAALVPTWGHREGPTRSQAWWTRVEVP